MTQRRFTISVPENIDRCLTALKKEKFYDRSRNEMINYLIKLGLDQTSASTPPPEAPEEQ